MSPKFKVGDRIIFNKDPECTSIIKYINYKKMEYVVDDYVKGKLLLINERWSFENIEDHHTLDLNNYIKSL